MRLVELLQMDHGGRWTEGMGGIQPARDEGLGTTDGSTVAVQQRRC